MSPDRWAKLDHLFHTVALLDKDERRAFLDRECGQPEDEDLRAQVERMIAADEASDAADAYVENAVAEGIALATDAEGDRPVSGTRLGPYRVGKLIGRGGMGAVYLGSRTDGEFEKTVAIKIIDHGGGGFTSKAAAARFRAERQILASLEHPNCCRLLDGGIGPNGAPYIVMEYVEGVRIDEYAKPLGERARLDLFLQLLAAVECAHQNLIVHRDIKPGNVLVSTHGVVKLLDFGIAKLLGPGGVESAEHTRSIEILATPGYASPEQMRGDAVTTASDIYSLGKVLLILTGPDASAELRAIALKSTHEEAGRRYPSAGQFADDVRRYLNGFPVTARPDSWTYRAAKFVKRNRLATAAAFLAALSIGAGIVSTRREQQRTERRFNEVREIATSFLFEFHEAVRNLPGSTEARRLLVTRALKYLEALSSDAGGVGLERDLAEAYSRVAQIQYTPASGSLGDPKGALESHLKELGFREAIQASLQDRVKLAECLRRMSDAARGAHKDATVADGYLARAAELSARLVREAPGDFAVNDIAAGIAAQTGLGRLSAGDPKSALDKFEEGIRLREQLAKQNPGHKGNLRLLGWTYVYSGDARGGGGTEINLGDRKGALEQTTRGLEIFEGLFRGDPNNAVAARDRNAVRARVAGIHEATGNLAESLRIRQELLPDVMRRHELDRKNADAARSVYTQLHSIGLNLMKMDRFAEAHEVLQRAKAHNEERMKARPGDMINLTDQANVEQAIGSVYKRQNRNEAALPHLRAALALREEFLKGGTLDSRLAWRQARAYESLAATELASGHREQGIVSLETALAWYRRLEKTGTLSPEDRELPAKLEKKIGGLRGRNGGLAQ